MMTPPTCPYCEYPAILADSAEVYAGRSYGPIWICGPCGAYVGCHKGTTRPLGRLADAELRAWKRRAHEAFDPLWQSGGMTRHEAYWHMAAIMGLRLSEAHIGEFDVEQCERLVERLSSVEATHE